MRLGHQSAKKRDVIHLIAGLRRASGTQSAPVSNSGATLAKCLSFGEPSVKYRSSQRSAAPLVLRRPALGVEVDELERVLERQVRELASCVLGEPECTALDRSAEADVRVRLGGHERMFSFDAPAFQARGSPRTICT